MADRAYLHQLVDSIPEELLDNAQRMLEYQGIGSGSAPGKLPQATVDAIRRRMREHLAQPDNWETLREKMRRGTEARVRRQMMQGIDFGGKQPDGASSSVQGRDDQGALLLLTFRYFKGQKLEITERISVSPDGHLLFYHQEVTGPDTKHFQQEAEFSISDSR